MAYFVDLSLCADHKATTRVHVPERSYEGFAFLFLFVNNLAGERLYVVLDVHVVDEV